MKQKQVRLSPETHKLLMQHKVDTGMDMQTTVARAVERELSIGEWVTSENEKHYCSNCDEFAMTHLVLSFKMGEHYSVEEYLTNRCPNCGTKMKQTAISSVLAVNKF